ncbi:hypothetical protein ACRN94_21300, partial [Shewanella baltica]
ASSLNSALNVFLVVDLMCSPKVIYEVIISPLFRWPKLVCHYTLAFNEGANQTYISKQLGHASVLTTEKHYLKWNKSPNKVERDRASQKINSIFERFTTAQG